ncbi:hypothetical protein EVAR_81673_1 [Eumeta japonica]|uniref:Uncharacterized protein n=1 Tax=Eumeta variegata TaxID=151549 RepID=A0A4C1V257_EUMVA|nr:hypothetical protein EVAR_81673_1 [Eumeta japonica]
MHRHRVSTSCGLGYYSSSGQPRPPSLGIKYGKGYDNEYPENDIDKFVRTATPVSRRGSSSASSPVTSQNSSRSHSPSKGNKKRRASSSSSDEETTCSDITLVGSDDESGSESEKFSSKSIASLILVEGKYKKAIRRALKKSKIDCSSPVRDMEVVIDRVTEAGEKPNAPPKDKAPRPICLLKEANFVQILADCTVCGLTILRPSGLPMTALKLLALMWKLLGVSINT